MKKNIAIVLLSISTLLFFTYSFIKADEAEKFRVAAELAKSEVLMAIERAKEQEIRALESAAEARKAMMQAERAIADCQNK